MSSSVVFKVIRDMAMWMETFDGPTAIKLTMVSKSEFVYSQLWKKINDRVKITMVIIIGMSKQYIPLDVIK